MAEIEELLKRGFQERQRDLPEEALQWFVRASELDGDDQSIRLEIARSYLDLAERQKGIQILLTIETDPSISDDAAEFALDLARLWVRSGEPDRALSIFRSIPLHKKDLASQAIVESTLLLERTHRLDDAWAELKRHPCMPLRGRSRGRKIFLSASLAHAVLSERSGDLESAVKRLQRTLKDAQPSSGLALECGYRLARLLDRLNQPQESLKTVVQCKKMEREQMPGGNLEEHIRKRRASDSAVLSDLPDDWFVSRPPTAGSKRVVILGHPRSGTSLLAHLLSKWSGACWIDECPAFSVLARHFGRQHAVEGESFASYLRLLTDETVNQFEGQYVERLSQQIPRGLCADSNAKAGSCLIDKNPGLSNSLPALNRLLPGSAWIYVERDPRDVAVSCYLQRLGSTPLGYACLTPEGVIDAVFHTAKLWTVVKARLRDDQAIVVRYEELVQDPMKVISSIATRLGWCRNENTSLEPAIVHSPTYSEVLRPIDSSTVGRWTQHPSFFGSFSSDHQQLVEELGY